MEHEDQRGSVVSTRTDTSASSWEVAGPPFHCTAHSLAKKAKTTFTIFLINVVLIAFYN